MYSFIAKNIIYPLGDLAIGTSVIKYYHWLQKTQWWSPEQIRELQNTELKALIKHAYYNVPYYQKLFKERGLTYQDIQTVDDLTKLPILTKNEIRQNFDSISARNLKKWKPILNSTGGSTGEPLKYYITKNLASITWAGMFRGWKWAGYQIGDKRIKFGGSSLIPDKSPSLFDIVRDKLERNVQYSALSIDESRYDSLVRIIRKNKPEYFYGLASATYLFSDYCKNNNITDIKFKAVFCTAEVLLRQYRTGIENQFQCKVFDEYGSNDGGGQALECEIHKGFHISAEKVILETVDGNGNRLPPGKSGRIIVTDLFNYAIPFLRYEVGDIGVLSEDTCVCGRTLPLLKSVEGRTTDIIKLSNGVTLSGLTIPVVFEERPVKQYQVIQEAKDRLLVKIVKDVNYSELDSDYILKLLRHHAGKDIQIDLEFQDTIPVTGNSKFKYVISKV